MNDDKGIKNNMTDAQFLEVITLLTDEYIVLPSVGYSHITVSEFREYAKSLVDRASGKDKIDYMYNVCKWSPSVTTRRGKNGVVHMVSYNADRDRVPKCSPANMYLRRYDLSREKFEELYLKGEVCHNCLQRIEKQLLGRGK